MLYRPGDSYFTEFTTQRLETGVATDADSLPVATANKNGTDDGSFTLTVTNLDTGRYKITGTVPGGYTAGDKVVVTVAATVNGVAGKARVDQFQITGINVNDATAAGISRVDASVSSRAAPGAAMTLAAGAVNAAAIASDTDVYQAKVNLLDDNTGSNDRYVVVFFKNSEPVTSGITSPAIQVIKVSDGTDLVASTSLTQIGSTGLYKYSEPTNRVVDGAAYIAKVTATINSATRTWFQPVGRDS